ncbi:hypothetical protein TRVA0_020S00958 [Trichomonascus vanleenenianus]|uniref:uncharacterized protein n=1 Tax=Trichomonascus vanleenenianus TaxID=2268995 RepID=UPI003ECAD5EF
MWSHDFCTVCDKQCPQGAMYCSDKCRMIEQTTSEEIALSMSFNPSPEYLCRYHATSSGSCTCDHHSEDVDYFSLSPASNLPAHNNSVCSSSSSNRSGSDHFMYDSPLLLPQGSKSSASLASSVASSEFLASPTLSPLLIPSSSTQFTSKETASGVSTTPAMTASLNYRRWLTAAAV